MLSKCVHHQWSVPVNSLSLADESVFLPRNATIGVLRVGVQLLRWYEISVIYLSPTSCLTVELPLTSSWSFSAIYLLSQTAITSREEQQIIAQSSTWIVGAEPDSRLVDMTSEVRVAYHTWEATYVMLFCISPTPIKLFLSFFLLEYLAFPAQMPISSRQTPLV